MRMIIITLGTADIAAFSSDQLGAVTTAQIPAFTTAQLAGGITTTQAAFLTTTQVSLLSSNQIAALSSASFGALTADTSLSDKDASHNFRWIACGGGAGEVVAHLDHYEPPAGRCERAA